MGQVLCPADDPHTCDDPEAIPAPEYLDQALYGYLKQMYDEVGELAKRLQGYSTTHMVQSVSLLIDHFYR